MSSLGRVATWIAVGVLAVNAVLLGAAGLVAGRPLLLGASAASALGAGAVGLAWRHHRQTLDAMAADRRALRDEALALRELVRRPPS